MPRRANVNIFEMVFWLMPYYFVRNFIDAICKCID